MISTRCKIVVGNELDKLGLHHRCIELGKVEIGESVSPNQMHQLEAAFQELGFELMRDKKSILIQKIKTIIIDLVHRKDDMPRINFSSYLSKKLLQDYSSLSVYFSKATGTTIEHYFIAQKIERVKELLLYDELNLTEISYNLHYSSVAHLSNQFKKITGLTPTYFKQLKQHKKRIALDQL